MAAKTHTVVWGDTLSELAVKYNTTIYQLQVLNAIKDPDKIYVGQVLKISGSSSSSSSSSTGSTNKVNINHFGLQVGTESTLYAKWEWSKANTESYQVEWSYYVGGLWFMGNDTTIDIKDSTYSYPSNATKARVRVKPISKTHTVNDNETRYWTAEWSDYRVYNVSDSPPAVLSTPSITIDGYKLTVELNNVEINGNYIEFQIVQDNRLIIWLVMVKIEYGYASYSCTVKAGHEYKVRARGYNGNILGDWSDFSDNVSSAPAVTDGITVYKASSETSVYLEWAAAKGATKYAIEYTTKKAYFDGSNQTTTVNDIKFTHYEITGLESGQEYFFRVKSLNDDNRESGWSDIVSVVIGKAPSAPTTWSSTTTVKSGEDLTLYWVHNSEDNSSQTFAELELIIGGVKETHTIENSTEEDEKDKTSFYVLSTSQYLEGTTIEWRVRTAGVTKVYGDWSTQRTVAVYAPPTLELDVTDFDGNSLDTITSFPFYISVLAGPNTQAPIGFHVAITSNDTYDTTDKIGNETRVKRGDVVYSKQFTPVNNTVKKIVVEMSAGNVDLQNGMDYTVNVTVGMNSGLNAEAERDISVSWAEETFMPNAEISIDVNAYTATIRPYCRYADKLVYYKVNHVGTHEYVLTDEEVGPMDGLIAATTVSGEPVYVGVNDAGEYMYYSMFEEVGDLVDNVKLAVYRREFDGTFTELVTGLDNTIGTSITDPHPALDYARYRIVATTVDTGAVCYYDMPPYPVNGKSIVIQWDEEWDSFDITEKNGMVEPSWAGSLLKLPYNVDVSEAPKKDVTMVKYAGRTNPVSYYGTQIDTAPSWNATIDKKDKETIYALRRLAIWKGDVYIREPSGVGYWANVNVSFSQKHKDPAVPVTLDITRVEGGI